MFNPTQKQNISDIDGEITIGDDPKKQERIGTIKLWNQPTSTDDRPLYKGFIMIDGNFHRVALWKTPKV